MFCCCRLGYKTQGSFVLGLSDGNCIISVLGSEALALELHHTTSLHMAIMALLSLCKLVRQFNKFINSVGSRSVAYTHYYKLHPYLIFNAFD
jgi:hypothetical protein